MLKHPAASLSHMHFRLNRVFCTHTLNGSSITNSLMQWHPSCVSAFGKTCNSYCGFLVPYLRFHSYKNHVHALQCLFDCANGAFLVHMILRKIQNAKAQVTAILSGLFFFDWSKMCLPGLQKAYYTCLECAGLILNLAEHGIGVFTLYSFYLFNIKRICSLWNSIDTAYKFRLSQMATLCVVCVLLPQSVKLYKKYIF